MYHPGLIRNSRYGPVQKEGQSSRDGRRLNAERPVVTTAKGVLIGLQQPRAPDMAKVIDPPFAAEDRIAKFLRYH